MRKRTPWARIYEAGLNGTGCRLTAEDVAQLMCDDAITERGSGDLELLKQGRDPHKDELYPYARKSELQEEAPDA